MRLVKVKIGDLISVSNERNVEDKDLPFYGINKDKEFMPTIASIDNVDKSKYKIMTKGRFVFSGMQTGRDNCIRIGLYRYEFDSIVSPAYTTFEVTNKLINPEYLFMIFKSSEMDRYGSFLSDGSIRANLDWDVFCNIKINLPDIETQNKYVAIYKAMQDNIKVYESKLEDLKLVCDGYIENLRKKIPCEKLGEYIEKEDLRNSDNKIKKVVGLSTKKEFREAQSTVNKNQLTSYKIVKPQSIAFVPTTDTWKVLAFAVNNFGYDIVVSPIYEVFKIININKLLPEYLAIWLKRTEFDRYARYNSWGSARENFLYNDMCEVKIPIPDISVQKDIVNIYKVLNDRKRISKKLKEQINNICPILIAGAVKEGTSENE